MTTSAHVFFLLSFFLLGICECSVLIFSGGVSRNLDLDSIPSSFGPKTNWDIVDYASLCVF